MKKVWSTLVVASFGAFCATGCMTPDVSNTYQPRAGDIGMRAYGSSGCIDVEEQKAQLAKQQQTAWQEPRVVATTTATSSSSIISDPTPSIASAVSVADDDGWVEISPSQTIYAASVADDDSWVEITP